MPLKKGKSKKTISQNIGDKAGKGKKKYHSSSKGNSHYGSYGKVEFA